MEPKDRKEFAELRERELKTARASALKETAMALYIEEFPASNRRLGNLDFTSFTSCWAQNAKLAVRYTEFMSC